MSDFSYEIGSDNIAVIKWDVPNKKFNVLTIEGIDGIEKILDELFENNGLKGVIITCLLYTSPSPRDPKTSRMPSSA